MKKKKRKKNRSRRWWSAEEEIGGGESPTWWRTCDRGGNADLWPSGARTALGKYMRQQGCGGAHGLVKVANIGVGKIPVGESPSGNSESLQNMPGTVVGVHGEEFTPSRSNTSSRLVTVTCVQVRIMCSVYKLLYKDAKDVNGIYTGHIRFRLLGFLKNGNRPILVGFPASPKQVRVNGGMGPSPERQHRVEVLHGNLR